MESCYAFHDDDSGERALIGVSDALPGGAFEAAYLTWAGRKRCSVMSLCQVTWDSPTPVALMALYANILSLAEESH